MSSYGNCCGACFGVQGGGRCAVADLGGSIITGIDGNPLSVLAAQARMAWHLC
jgi:hypothetical protein